MYGDQRSCKCGQDAKLVEKGRDYCCDCYARVILGKTMAEIEEELKHDSIS